MVESMSDSTLVEADGLKSMLHEASGADHVEISHVEQGTDRKVLFEGTAYLDGRHSQFEVAYGTNNTEEIVLSPLEVMIDD